LFLNSFIGGRGRSRTHQPSLWCKIGQLTINLDRAFIVRSY
jgi:hypothetical protein